MTGALNSLFHVYDKSSRCKFLVDTGAEVSVFSATSRDQRFGRKGLELQAANGSRIKSYGSKLLKIRLPCGTFQWLFILADVGLPRAAWVKLNRLRSGVGRFCSSMYKWGLAPLANCECGASEQIADHIISQCPIHRAPRGMFGLMVLDDETRCWLKSLTVSI